METNGKEFMNGTEEETGKEFGRNFEVNGMKFMEVAGK